MNRLWQFHGGIKPPGHKTPASNVPIQPARIPNRLILPLLQHAGIPAIPQVRVGDSVLKGQVIAHCRDPINPKPGSVRLHAPTSGTIAAIENRPVAHASGLSSLCVVLESDHRDTWGERYPINDCTTLSPDELRLRIAQAGIVGLGGAGFPSHIKLLTQEIDTLILNGAECEPYISCDDRLMRERPQQILIGAKILSHLLGGVQRCIVALEDNTPQAFATLRDSLDNPQIKQALQNFDIQVQQVPALYPMGGERQLIYTLTGKEVPRGKVPSQAGIVVHNVETAAAIHQAVRYGEPLISRIVTVTGNAVEKPQNLEVLLGTPIKDLLAQCGLRTEPAQLLMGGPMMGMPLASAEVPVIKTMNCIIASTSPPSKQAEMPCIRCGACEEVCPAQLLPQQLYWYARAKDIDKLEQQHLFDCIECGCCAYVCPSNLPLVHYYRYAKGEIRQQRQEREKAETAKKRYEFREFRLAREKAEREARHAQKRAALAGTVSTSDNHMEKTNAGDAK